MPLETHDFDEFFAAVNGGNAPFPWQRRFLDEVVDRLGDPDRDHTYWPAVVDLPTGSGKTSLLDIAVFLLAMEASRPPHERRVPRRILFVVDRRVVVDQANQHAQAVAKALADPFPSSPVMARVAEALRSYSAGTGDSPPPLVATLLRGGIVRDESWARRPDVPTIISSTVDQVGSRLLFRGYGLSDSMRPIHAGLLGSDTLFLLDEVHLSQPFAQTLRMLAMNYQREWADRLVPARWEVVELSATPRPDSGELSEVFGLSERFGDFKPEDNETLFRRLSASKLVSFPAPVKITGTDRAKTTQTFATACAKQAQELLSNEGARTIAVVVNRVDTAVAIWRVLSEKKIGATLLTGRMRPYDRERILNDELKERLRTGHSREVTQDPLVVVATQCIEAGADFDFDAMVSECASIDALVQRFGRVDRDGQLAQQGTPARSVVLVRSSDLKGDADAVYGHALAETWQTLSSAEAIDFGIRTFPAELKGQPHLRSTTPDAPLLFPGHLDAWVQTSPAPTPDPDPKFWLHGPDDSVSDVTVVWRSGLTEALLREAQGKDDDDDIVVALRTLLVATPPGALEAMSVPLNAVRKWLYGETSQVSDVEFDVTVSDEPSPKNGDRPAVRWEGDRSVVVRANELRPGHILIMPAGYGGIGVHGSWDPLATEPVVDLAERSQLIQRRRAVLRLVPDVLRNADGKEHSIQLPILDEDPDEVDADVMRRWLAVHMGALEGAQKVVASYIHRALNGPALERRRVEIQRVVLDLPGQEQRPHLVVSAAVKDSPDQVLANLGAELLESMFDLDAVDSELDTSSFTSVKVGLDRHLRGVEQWAQRLALNCGLPREFVDDLALAGRLHDLGKADKRFQVWLRNGNEVTASEEPLAKSDTSATAYALRQQARRRSGYPPGARHELMSLAMIESADELRDRANDWDLVRHLVASHHGWCRPFAPAVIDSDPLWVTHEVDGLSLVASSKHQLERLDSGVADRFWLLVRRYGWFRLAWFEALLRLADHRESEQEQREGESEQEQREGEIESAAASHASFQETEGLVGALSIDGGKS